MVYVPKQTSVKLEGFAEFEQQLRQVAADFRADKASRQVLVPAAKEAMQSVLFTAQSMAPVGVEPRDAKNPIHMRDTLRLDARIPNGRDKQSEYVKETDAAIAVVSVKKSAVSLANEFGTKKMAAQPFMRPALERNLGVVLTDLKSELAVRIPEFIKKLNRRKK